MSDIARRLEKLERGQALTPAGLPAIGDRAGEVVGLLRLAAARAEAGDILAWLDSATPGEVYQHARAIFSPPACGA